MTSPSPPNDTDNDTDQEDDTPHGVKLPSLTRLHWILIAVVAAGAALIAGIGFSGSYSAVRQLAAAKGFGGFAPWMPIGVDAGIIVCLALDLLLTWIRIPFPLLRQTAWLLTAATISFNAAAAWPDPLGVGMHAVIPVLFIVAVEAARHAIGRIADLTADRHMEGVRLSRWLLSPVPTFRLWRRMKLWELRSYERVVRMEQDRLVYEARLRARFGRGWRRKAPVDAMTPLRLARYGVPLAVTGPSGLKAAGITSWLPFADTEALSARTTPVRAGLMSAAADKSADTADNTGADKQADNTAPDNQGGMSARTSAPAHTGTQLVRADNGGHPPQAGKTQASPRDTGGVVRPDSVLRPLLAARTTATVRPDNTRTGTEADNRADKDTDNTSADKPGADNDADKRPLAADTADNAADNKPVVRTGRRGEVSDGVRAQLAAGVTSPREIAANLTEALGREIDPKNIGRIVRREQEKKRETYAGQYL